MLITKHELCTGCGVCASICPQKAIKMTSSKRGFLYPAVDDNICIHCNRCIKQCPVKHDNVAEQSIYYQMVGRFVQRDFQMIFQGYFLIFVKVNQNCINLGVRNMCKVI